MIKSWRLVVFLGVFAMCGPSALAQQYLVLDRYGKTRVKVPLGSEITFKLKGDKRKHQSTLVGLADSVVIMGDRDIYLHLDDFEVFYFHRAHWKALRYGTMFPAAGFLISAAVHPLVSNPFYDQEDSALIGLGFLALGQSFRLLEWKKFKLDKNARVWVGGFE
jgi:hypothetical protein